MAVSCIVMFSGGLDSVIAVHLLKSQGLDVIALHFILPFESGLGKTHATVCHRADVLGIPLEIIEEQDEFLDVLKSPSFGFGKNANPCIDCRIHRLLVAKNIMIKKGASFIATGEVLGQRPMSQRADALNSIEKRSDLRGLLLRPLSARLLKPTLPEEKGWVDRDKLLAIRGRGRSEQLAYAARFGLEHGAPAGGCILTNEATARRFTDLASHEPDFTFENLRLIAWGRRFRLSPGLVLAVGRNEHENEVLEKITLADDWAVSLDDFAGPYAIARGEIDDDSLKLCGAIIARYSRDAAALPSVRVTARRGGEIRQIDVAPAVDLQFERFRL